MTTYPSRLVAAAHYVIARTEPAKLGAVKLNKVLWFSDVEHYRRTGKSITGLTNYIRLPKGPVPQHIDAALSELKAAGKITERRTKVFTYERREFVWLQEPDIDIFSADEIDLLNQAIDAIKDLTADEISEITHLDDLWIELENGFPMPIAAASVVSRSPTESELRWASEVKFG